MQRRCLWLIAAVLWAGGSPLSALDTLTVVSTSADPGASAVLMTLTGTNDLAMQGFSFSASYPPLNLTCSDVSIAGTIVQTVSPLGVPEYFQFLIDDTLGTVIAGVISK